MGNKQGVNKHPKGTVISSATGVEGVYNSLQTETHDLAERDAIPVKNKPSVQKLSTREGASTNLQSQANNPNDYYAVPEPRVKTEGLLDSDMTSVEEPLEYAQVNINRPTNETQLVRPSENPHGVEAASTERETNDVTDIYDVPRRKNISVQSRGPDLTCLEEPSVYSFPGTQDPDQSSSSSSSSLTEVPSPTPLEEQPEHAHIDHNKLHNTRQLLPPPGTKGLAYIEVYQKPEQGTHYSPPKHIVQRTMYVEIDHDKTARNAEVRRSYRSASNDEHEEIGK